MTTRQRHYRAYLLRLWQIDDGDMAAWRASLETPGTGERRGFGSLEELCRWLQDQAWGGPCEGPPADVHKEENHA